MRVVLRITVEGRLQIIVMRRVAQRVPCSFVIHLSNMREFSLGYLMCVDDTPVAADWRSKMVITDKRNNSRVCATSQNGQGGNKNLQMNYKRN